jgi:protein-L-isoaspartate(D-aspartate) O-methyltransferase
MWHSTKDDVETALARDREAMVQTQIAARGVKDTRVLDAMRRIPRHRFVPPSARERAYGDYPAPIGYGQTISQPYMVALMTEMLELTPRDRVLEIGTGSAYQAAILSQLAAEVVSVERNEPLADRARTLLEELGCANVTVITGDGTLGYPERAPYDAIIVTAGGPAVPESLKKQLAVGGRLVCPVGSRDVQELITVRRTPERLDEETGISCVFVPLVGAEGWDSQRSDS